MIVVIAGVSGSGKSTVGSLLAGRLGWPFADGDDFHPAANVAKMRAGVPLADADRGPWLAAIGAWMDERAAAGQSAVLACSALRRAYRDALLSGRPAARMVFLAVSHDEDTARLAARRGHFFPAALLESQFAALELPQDPERVTVLPAAGDPAALVAEIMSRLGLTSGEAGQRPGPR